MLILFFSGVMGTQLIKTQKCQKYFLKTTKRQLKKTVHKKGAEKATKLRAEQSTHFLVVLLWLCYGSRKKERDSNSIAIFVFISLLRSSSCKHYSGI